MARYGLEEIYFSIKDAPGPFRLVAEEVQSHEDHTKRFIVELTVTPLLQGEKLFDHPCHRDVRIKIPFEVALKGVTTAMGHGVDHPRNVRLLGRFWPGATEMLVHHVDQEKVAPVLAEWQWEVIFNPQGRTGYVFRIPEPLPEVWTM
ncbi:MAG: hypothetical protein AAB646_03195 [Patescibacteria group bacterium]